MFYTDKTWHDFDQSERAQGPIYIIKRYKMLWSLTWGVTVMWSVMLVTDVKSSKFLHVYSIFRVSRSLPFREHMNVF